jgi:hypothetical protein
MNLAVEYLLRNGCIRNMFRMPISLCLFNQEKKLVVTIKEETPLTDCCTVNHWNITDCQFYQVLPSISEYRIAKENLFSHHSVMLPGWTLLKYRYESVPAEQNSDHTPMLEEVYKYYYEDIFDSLLHRETKVNWIWAEFIETYIPEIWHSMPYISTKDSLSELAEKQRTFVMNNHPKLWGYWKKWNRYMLFPEFIPGELVFT